MPDERELAIQEIQANVVEIAAIKQQLDDARVDDPDAPTRVTFESANSDRILSEIDMSASLFASTIGARQSRLAQLEELRRQYLAEIQSLGGAS